MERRSLAFRIADSLALRIALSCADSKVLRLRRMRRWPTWLVCLRKRRRAFSILPGRAEQQAASAGAQNGGGLGCCQSFAEGGARTSRLHRFDAQRLTARPAQSQSQSAARGPCGAQAPCSGSWSGQASRPSARAARRAPRAPMSRRRGRGARAGSAALGSRTRSRKEQGRPPSSRARARLGLRAVIAHWKHGLPGSITPPRVTSKGGRLMHHNRPS